MVIAAFLRPGTTAVVVRRAAQSSAVLCDSCICVCWPPRLINVGCCDVASLWEATCSPGARVSVLSPSVLLPGDIPVACCEKQEVFVDVAADPSAVIVVWEPSSTPRLILAPSSLLPLPLVTSLLLRNADVLSWVGHCSYWRWCNVVSRCVSTLNVLITWCESLSEALTKVTDCMKACLKL